MNQASPAATETASNGRIGALDTLRGIALLAMAHYHLTWDMELFGYLEPGTATQGWLKIYARTIASSFLFLAGFSLYLAHKRGVNWASFRKRLLTVVAAALLISVATYFATPGGWIFFGILHNIAAASLIGLIFLRLPFFVTLIFAAAALMAPHYLSSEIFNTNWLAWIGLNTIPPRSNDYVPLLPFLAPFLLGIAVSQFVTPRGWLDRFKKPSRKRNIIAFFGRHSLSFYLIHQPVLISLVYLVSLAFPPAPVDQVEAYKNSCVASCTQEQNGLEICERFCGCTLEKLQAANVFEPMVANKLTPDQQTKLSEIASECSAQIQ